MSDYSIKSILWWICLVAAPAVLIGIELFHPAGFTAEPGMYQFLSKPHTYQPHFEALDYFGPSWWFALHMIQTPMVGLVAVGLWLLVEPINRSAGALPMILAWLSRAATLIFVIYYTALDATGGIGLGRTIVIAQELASSGQLDAQQLKGVILVLNTMWTDPWVGGVGSFISETGSWGALAAPLFAALAWVVWRPRAWPPLIVLVAFGWELQTSHASPHGPIAFTLLVVASVWLWFQRPNRDPRQPPEPGRPAPRIGTPRVPGRFSAEGAGTRISPGPDTEAGRMPRQEECRAFSRDSWVASSAAKLPQFQPRQADVLSYIH
jgi:hypothetical protein